MPPHRITFLMHDMASPALGSVTVLANHLLPDHDVEIVGPDIGCGVCSLYRNTFPYTIVPCPRLYRFPDYFREARRLENAIRGDLIIAVKAFASSVPVALALKRRRGAKVLAYLDEWDGALMARLPFRQKIKRWLHHFKHPMDDVYNPWVERLLPKCDGVLSTSTALQRKFGGEVLPIGVDMNAFAPQPPDESAALRARLGLQNKRLIVFGGVARPHKGLDLILAALAQIADPNLLLLLVGPENQHVHALRTNPAFSPFLYPIGPRPKKEMPRYLGMADLIILPLQNDPLAQTQMPCKIFEAMAMAKPIIASAVSDIPSVLAHCGWTVPPHDLHALVTQIRYLLNHPDQAAAAGQRARQKCAAHYSAPVAARQLRAAIHRFTHSPP